MKTITNLSKDYKQAFKYPIKGYSTVSISIEFRENQLAWFLFLKWGSFSINNSRIAVSNNLLDQFKNIIPFGIAIYGPDNIDPFSLDAWTRGWSFNILNSTEILT